MTDTEIISKVLLDDTQAFQLLVERYQLLVVKTCQSFVHNDEDAQDLAQDVFLEVFQSLDTFRNESKISTWVYRICVNKSLNFLRSRKRRQWVLQLESLFQGKNSNETEWESDEQNTPFFRIENAEKASILHSAIESLPENQKIAFTLSKYEELSYKEISEVMRVSVSSVESLLHRAKLNLQKKLVHYYKNNL